MLSRYGYDNALFVVIGAESDTQSTQAHTHTRANSCAENVDTTRDSCNSSSDFLALVLPVSDLS